MKIAVGKKSRVTQPVSWRTVLDCVFSFGLIEIKPGLRSCEIFIPSCKTLQKIFFFLFDKLKYRDCSIFAVLLSYSRIWKPGSADSQGAKKGLNTGPWARTSPCLEAVSLQGSPDSQCWRPFFPAFFHILPKTICKLENSHFLS